MRSFFCFLSIGLLLCIYAACDADEQAVSADDYLAGGETTVFEIHSNAYQLPATNLSATEIERHLTGDAAFESTFVTAPATNNGGLGPIYNNVSCSSCHNKNGKAHPPQNSETLGGLLFRISVAGSDSHNNPNPVIGFGGQLQTSAVFNKQPEAHVNITYQQQVKQFLDGENYTLSMPIYTLINPYIPLPTGYLLSPRIASNVFGLGLLELIPEGAILANADELDTDQDGISGKANEVWDIQLQSFTLGRFGWKAGQPSVLQQTAAAYVEDMGITNPLFTIESCNNQTQCDNLNDEPEIPIDLLRNTAFYTQSLGVPAPRNLSDPKVLQGKKIFADAKCDKCHIDKWVTGNSIEFPFLANQTIRPYTDLLLHDMGENLADNRPEAKANGQEWRTPPLWGIGLSELVSGHNTFLHDGRANNLLEAVMWHGGEAEESRNHIEKLSKDDRDALIAFLKAL